jgi:hypothetical protein
MRAGALPREATVIGHEAGAAQITGAVRRGAGRADDETRHAGTGEFRFELEGRDAQDGFGTAREFSLTAHGGLVWQQPSSGSAGVDVRLLEGFSGGASVLAEDERPGPDTRIRTRYRAQRVPYVTSVPPPPSRGTDCVVEHSVDDRTWQPLATAGEPFAAATVDAGTPVRYPRISSSAPTLQLAEVSGREGGPDRFTA